MNLLDKLKSQGTASAATTTEAPAAGGNALLARLQARNTGINPPAGSPTPVPVTVIDAEPEVAPEPVAAAPAKVTPQKLTPGGKPKRITCADKSCRATVPTKGDMCEKHGLADIQETIAAKIETIKAEAPPSGVVMDAVVSETVKAVVKAHGPTLTVIFDAVYGKGQNGAVHLSEFMRPVLDAICEANKVEHWAMSGFYTDARTMLQAKFKAYLDNGLEPGTVLLADSDTPECGIVKDLLIEKADIVIRGLR